MMKIGDAKSPQEEPPPSCESPTPSRDEVYRGSRSPSSRFCRQMARKKRASQQIIFNAITKKKNARKG
jgi:hypothetical protein